MALTRTPLAAEMVMVSRSSRECCSAWSSNVKRWYRRMRVILACKDHIFSSELTHALHSLPTCSKDVGACEGSVATAPEILYTISVSSAYLHDGKAEANALAQAVAEGQVAVGRLGSTLRCALNEALGEVPLGFL